MRKTGEKSKKEKKNMQTEAHTPSYVCPSRCIYLLFVPGRTADGSRAHASFPSVSGNENSSGGAMFSNRAGTAERTTSGSGRRRRPAAPPPYDQDDEGKAATPAGDTTRAGHSLRQQVQSASAARAEGLAAPAAPAVPFHPVLPAPHDTAVSSSSSSRAAAAGGATPSVAPAYTLPVRKSFRHPDEPVVANQPAVYLFTDQYPFTAHQFDKENEARLVCHTALKPEFFSVSGFLCVTRSIPYRSTESKVPTLTTTHTSAGI